MDIGFGAGPREDEQVDGGFGVEVFDYDEVGILRDDGGRGKGSRTGDVWVQAVAAGWEDIFGRFRGCG